VGGVGTIPVPLQSIKKEKEHMAALTLGEKGHWRDRIAKRIDQRIETVVAKSDPTFLQRVEREAQERAYRSLGIDAQQGELEAVQKQKEELDQRERRLSAEQSAIVNGTSIEKAIDAGDYYHSDSVENAVNARAKALESEILAESELGCRILSLREEKDNLLDTVWLATSSSQIKELWEQVNALLEIKPTALEEKALKIAPVEEE